MSLKNHTLFITGASRGIGLAIALRAARVAIARFFAENMTVHARSLERTVIEGAESVTNADAALA